jgi:hypothetical protein
MRRNDFQLIRARHYMITASTPTRFERQNVQCVSIKIGEVGMLRVYNRNAPEASGISMVDPVLPVNTSRRFEGCATSDTTIGIVKVNYENGNTRVRDNGNNK